MPYLGIDRYLLKWTNWLGAPLTREAFLFLWKDKHEFTKEICQSLREKAKKKGIMSQDWTRRKLVQPNLKWKLRSILSLSGIHCETSTLSKRYYYFVFLFLGTSLSCGVFIKKVFSLKKGSGGQSNEFVFWTVCRSQNFNFIWQS